MGNSLHICRTGNIRKVRQHPKCRYIGKRKIRVMTKLDESEARHILRKSRKGVDTSKIAEEMNVSARWIRNLCQVQERRAERCEVSHAYGQAHQRHAGT